MKAVVFDVDGTLLESMLIDGELYRSAIRSVLGDVGLRASFGDYTDVTDTGILDQVFDDNALPRSARQAASVRTCFVSALDRHIRDNGPLAEIPGASRMIGRLLRSDDHAVAIATGGWPESALLKLTSSGFGVDDIPLATADDSPVRTEIMACAAAKLGPDIDSIVYFGDAEWDREACRRLGWDFVAVGSALGGISSYDDVFRGV